MLSKTDVIYAYHLILGRPPENDEIITIYCSTVPNLEELRKTLIQSKEFKQKYSFILSASPRTSNFSLDNPHTTNVYCTSCRICNGNLVHKWTLKVLLDRYDADYYECENCHTLQIPNPTWLEEAYQLENDLTSSCALDSGRFKRNFSVYNYLMALKTAGVIPTTPKILDFGGGYGLLTEMLLDSGHDAWNTDIYFTQPLFAPQRYIADMSSLDEASFDVIISIEVFEHLVDPLTIGQQLRRLLKPSGTLIISTGVYHPDSHTRDWWYLVRDAGQHITFWTPEALQHYAQLFQFASVTYFPQTEGFFIIFSALPKAELRTKLSLAKQVLNTPQQFAKICQQWDIAESEDLKKQGLSYIRDHFLQEDQPRVAQAAEALFNEIKRHGCHAELKTFVRTEWLPKVTPKSTVVLSQSDDYVQLLQSQMSESVANALANISYHHLRLGREEPLKAVNAILANVVDKYGWSTQIQILVEQELLPKSDLRTCAPTIVPPQNEAEYIAFLKNVQRGQISIQVKSPKILLDISSLGHGWYDPVCRVGIYRVVEQLAKGLLVRQSPENLAFCATETTYPAFAKTKGYLLAHPEFSQIPLYPLETPPEADIVHFPYYGLPGKIKTGQRFLTIHDLIPIKYTYFTVDLIEQQRAHLESLRPDDWVICVSQHTKDDFCEYTGFEPTRVFITHEAADPKVFHPCTDPDKRAQVRHKYGIPEAPYFLTLSNLEPRKNIDQIIRSFAHLVQEQHLTEVNLVLVGPKGHHYEKLLQETARLKIRVIVTGFVADEDMAAIYSGALAFVFMSFCEGFGLPPLEAMQCGVPVICSNTTSLPEVVGKAGILLNPTDGDGLSQSLWEVYQNASLRDKLAQQSLVQAQKFSWNNFMQETFKAYKTAWLYGDTVPKTKPRVYSPRLVKTQPLVEGKRPPRIIYDISPLGIGQYQQYGKAGIFRVVEKLATALLDLHVQRTIRLSFCATGYAEAFKQAKHFQVARPEFLEIPLLHPANLPVSDLFHSAFHPLPEEIQKAQRVLTVYDLIAIKLPHLNPNTQMQQEILKRLRSTDWVTCISQSAKDDLCEYTNFSADRVFVTYLAAEPNIFYHCLDANKIAEVRRKYRLAEAPYLLSVSTLEPRKNIEQVIRSFAQLVQQEKVADLQLVLVGAKGWQDDRAFQALLRNKALTGRIIVTGYAQDADLAALYTGALAFVYPSFYEGFGLPPLEAMQCGTPVITSNTSSLPEVVGDAGILLNPTDGDGLCQAILEVYQQPALREELSQKSLVQAQKFSWDKFVEETLAVYKIALSAEKLSFSKKLSFSCPKPPTTKKGQIPSLLYDISILGTSHHVSHGKGGIFRVVEKLADALANLDEQGHLDLSFCALGYRDAFKQATDYLAATPRFQQIPLYHTVNLPNTAIFHAPHFHLPGEIQKGERFLTVYDLIPIKLPQFFTGSHTADQQAALQTLKANDWVTCISQATKDDFCEYTGFAPERVFVTYLAADSEIFYPCTDLAKIAAVRQKYHIPDSPYLLTLCTLEPRKNIDQVIRSFARLLQQEHVRDLCLVLVGAKGWNYEKIFKEISSYPSLQRQIIITGYVQDDDLAALYSGALAFVYPSFYEGFGLPPLEAMQCGTPVITSNTSSLPEVIGEAGIMLNPTDTDGLCQAIWNLYRDSNLRTHLSSQSLAQAKQFSWEKFTQDTLNAYQTALLAEESLPTVLLTKKDKPVPRTLKQASLLYDISVLGLAHHHSRARTGVFRVVERLAQALIDLQPFGQLAFAATAFTDSWQLARDYQAANPKFQQVPLHSSANLPVAEIFHSPFYLFPLEAKGHKFLTVYDLIPTKFPQFFTYNEAAVQQETLRRLETGNGWALCISESTKNDLCNTIKLAPERIFVTPLAADSAIFYPCTEADQMITIRQKYRIPEAPYLLTLCTLEPRKNIDHIIRSFAALVQQEKVKDLNLVLVGTVGWKYEKIFAELAQQPALQQRIIVTGFVPDEDMAALYSGAMMFAYLSFYEGFGLPPLEAMQCGVPVVTANNSSLPEVVGEAGIMLEATDQDALCQSILNIYQHPTLRDEMARKSLAQAKKFSWEKFVAETLAAYRAALNSL